MLPALQTATRWKITKFFMKEFMRTLIHHEPFYANFNQKVVKLPVQLVKIGCRWWTLSGHFSSILSFKAGPRIYPSRAGIIFFRIIYVHRCIILARGKSSIRSQVKTNWTKRWDRSQTLRESWRRLCLGPPRHGAIRPRWNTSRTRGNQSPHRLFAKSGHHLFGSLDPSPCVKYCEDINSTISEVIVCLISLLYTLGAGFEQFFCN